MLKTVSSVANALGALNYKGTWNAATNTPTLASGVGTQGDYYVVSVSGATDLDGITNWGVGDWAAFNGSVWQRVEGGADGNFVNLDVTGTTTLDGATSVTGGNFFVSNGSVLTAGVLVDANGATLSFTRNTTSYIRNNAAGGQLTFTTNGDSASTVLNLGTTGNVTVGTGNLVMGTSGKGIDFSATAGAGTSELLADYEEGDWTPALANIGTGTYTHQVGRYTKVGNLVTASVHIDINVLGTASGSVDITNLPFTASNVSNNYGSASSIHAQNFTTAAEGLNVLINPNTAVANVFSGSGATSGAVSVTHAVMGTGNLLCTLVYFTA
jgi:hypothetical protein